MRRTAALADRHQAVQAAARDWRAAGIIDDKAVAAIAARFPDDRVRPGLVVRLLLFVFALIAGFAVLGLFETIGRIEWFGLILLGGAFAAVTEVQIGGLRRAGGGTEEACSLFAVGLITAGTATGLPKALDLTRGHDTVLIGVLLAVTAGAAAWRWGMPAWGAVAAVGIFIAITPNAMPRVMWCVVFVAGLVPLERARRSARLCPAHREAAGWTLAAGVALAYLACNVRSVDGAWIEEVFHHGSHEVVFDRMVAVLVTTLAPFAALAAGVRRRDRLWLALGGVMLAASAVTLRSYVHIAPTWAVLILAGVALVAVAGLVHRLLASGPNRERAGLTTEPLFEGRLQETAEVVAVLATVAPSAQPPGATPGPAPGGPRVDPGGGSFGGGGASDSF